MPKTALTKLGPCLTSKLAKHLSEKNGVTSVAARKQIERATASGDIKIVKDLHFAHNASFAYLPNQFATKIFNENLFLAMEEARSAMRLPLAAMRARGGCIPASLFPTISGVPIKSDNQLDSEDLKHNLLKLSLIEQEGGYLKFGKKAVITPNQVAARLAAESSVLSGFSDWLKGQRLIGNQMSLRFEDKPPQFGHYQWDFVGPSYIAPLVSRSNGKSIQGYIVADIILGWKIKSREVQYFLNKCANIRAIKSNRPFIAFLIADWFEQDALDLAQAKGVVFTTPKTLFGKKFGDAQEELRKTLERKEILLEEQAAKLAKLIEVTDELTTMKSLNDNLRGQLFEVMVGHCYQKQYGGTVLHGKHFPDIADVTKKLDCDVLQLTPGTCLHACECKGYRGTNKVTLSEAKKWFNKTVPAIRQQHSNADYPHQEFSFWTSGEFEDDALEWINRFAISCKRFAVTTCFGKDCENTIQKWGDDTIKDAYKRWFKPTTVRREKKNHEEYLATWPRLKPESHPDSTS